MSGVSVVIPTYNRAELLSRTLESLRDQVVDSETPYEVVVCDDGSADGTNAVVARFADRLDLRYAWQPDLGHRVSAARNMGISLAKYPVCCFLDCGTLASPGFVENHSQLHSSFVTGRTSEPLAVLGNTRGYRFDIDETAEPARSLLQIGTAEALCRSRSDTRFEDVRMGEARDFAATVLPWRLFWTTNVSVPTDLLRDLGGFDEDFQGWGGEDLELGYRLSVAGARFTWSHDAWALELPQPKDHDRNRVTNTRNLRLFLYKHQHVDVELFVGARELREPVADAVARFRAWQANGAIGDAVWWPVVRADLVANTLEFDAVRAVTPPAPARTDRELIVPALGIHLPLEDGRFSRVAISSRLESLWDLWRDLLVPESHRIARDASMVERVHSVRNHPDEAA